MEQLIFTAKNLFEQLPLFVIAVLILWVGKVFYDLTTKHDFNKELCENDNTAVGLSLGGYLVGVGLAIKGAFQDLSLKTTVTSIPLEGGGREEVMASSPLIDIAINGVIIILLMRLSVWVGDKFILYKFNVDKELVEDKNSGTGFVIAGSCIATGLMLCGVMSGTSESYSSMFTDILIYWLVGQIILILAAKFYTLVTRYDVHKVIEEDDNISAGLCFGAYLVAQGLIAYGSLNGASGNFLNEMIITGVAGLVGMITLICSSTIVDKMFLPKAKLVKEIVEDANLAAGTVVAAIFITVGITLSNIISSSI